MEFNLDPSFSPRQWNSSLLEMSEILPRPLKQLERGLTVCFDCQSVAANRFLPFVIGRFCSIANSVEINEGPGGYCDTQ